MDIDSVITWLREVNPVVGSIAAILAIAGVVFDIFKFNKNPHKNYYDTEAVAKLATKLASEHRVEDTQTIKALSEQNADKYNIEQALALLS